MGGAIVNETRKDVLICVCEMTGRKNTVEMTNEATEKVAIQPTEWEHSYSVYTRNGVLKGEIKKRPCLASDRSSSYS